MNGWEAVEYTSPYWPDDTGRTPGGLRYTAPHRFVEQTRPAPVAERRPMHSGEPVAPYVSRLAGLPRRTTSDWSGIVTGCATVYNTPLRANNGRPETFMPTSFARDNGVEVPILLLHDYDRHVGWATLQHRGRDGLYFTGQLNRHGAKRIGNWRGLSPGSAPTCQRPPDQPQPTPPLHRPSPRAVHLRSWLPPPPLLHPDGRRSSPSHRRLTRPPIF